MKTALLALPLLFAPVLATAPALALDHHAEGEEAAAFSTAMPIETLMADERARAVLDEHVPGIAKHPAYSQFKAMSLKAVAPMSGGAITEETLAAIDADLAEID
jgi:hypothetical protein